MLTIMLGHTNHAPCLPTAESKIQVLSNEVSEGGRSRIEIQSCGSRDNVTCRVTTQPCSQGCPNSGIAKYQSMEILAGYEVIGFEKLSEVFCSTYTHSSVEGEIWGRTSRHHRRQASSLECRVDRG